VLPPTVLRLARRLAINYHDALLPNYAGGNAVSWALLHGEIGHGVTWHEMTERIDAGGILAHRFINRNGRPCRIVNAFKIALSVVEDKGTVVRPQLSGYDRFGGVR
jgi:folate-dependent phosphoribosylglycinamide formyltransferase PurN